MYIRVLLDELVCIVVVKAHIDCVDVCLESHLHELLELVELVVIVFIVLKEDQVDVFSHSKHVVDRADRHNLRGDLDVCYSTTLLEEVGGRQVVSDSLVENLDSVEELLLIKVGEDGQALIFAKLGHVLGSG